MTPDANASGPREWWLYQVQGAGQPYEEQYWKVLYQCPENAEMSNVYRVIERKHYDALSAKCQELEGEREAYTDTIKMLQDIRIEQSFKIRELEARVRELEVELANYKAMKCVQCGDELLPISQATELELLQSKLQAAEAEIDRRNIATAAMESRLHEQNAELLSQVKLWKGRCDKNGNRLAACDDARVEALAWCERLAEEMRKLCSITSTVKSVFHPDDHKATAHNIQEIFKCYEARKESLAEFEKWRKTLRSSINETVISDTQTPVQNFPPKGD